jgi:hypothetical protein
MVSQLEAELRATLAERAQDVPADAGARLAASDYRPRTVRVRPRVAVGALAGSAGAVGLIAAVAGPGASSAFAGWSSSPTPAPEAQISAAQSVCNSQLAGGPSSGSSKPVLSDTRGPFTVLIFQTAGASTSCISGPGFTAVTTNGAHTASGKVTAEAGPGASAGVAGSQGPGGPAVTVGGAPDGGSAPAGEIRLSGTELRTPGGQPYTLVEGHTGTGVTAATLVLADGSDVTTTTANGWFAAWWPGSQDVTSALVTTPSGTATQSITGPTILPPPTTATGPGRSEGTTNCTAAPNGQTTCHPGDPGSVPAVGDVGAGSSASSG